MLDASMDKVYSMKEQMGNINREIEILSKKKKRKKEMLWIKNTITEMKNAFESYISRLDTDEERIPKLENTSVESSHTEKTEKRGPKQTKPVRKQKQKNKLLKNCGTYYKRCKYR